MVLIIGVEFMIFVLWMCCFINWVILVLKGYVYECELWWIRLKLIGWCVNGFVN